MGVSSFVHWVVWDSGLSWLSWCSVRGGDIPIGMMWHLFLFPYIILVHCLPHVTKVVINLLFGVGSCKKMFSSWVLASVLPNTLWFDKEGGFFCGRLESQCYQRLLMGKKKGTSAVQAAGLPCCLPTTGKVRILPLVPFLTVQEETMPAAAGWLTQGCNHAVGVLRAASSSTGLLTTPTFFPHLETTILWLRLSPPLGCSHIPPRQLHAGVTQSHTWCLMSVCLCGYLLTASDWGKINPTSLSSWMSKENGNISHTAEENWALLRSVAT